MGNIPSGGGAVSPLTTKGDIWGFSTTNARIPGPAGRGSDGALLMGDSTQATGAKWTPGPLATVGTFASLPSSPVTGQVYYFTDSWYTMAIYDGAQWNYIAPFGGAVGLPPASGWSYVNQASATLVATAGNLIWQLPNSSSSDRLLLNTPAITTPPWSYICGFTVYAANVNYFDYMFCVRNSATGYVAGGLAKDNIRFFNVAKTNTDALGPIAFYEGGGIPMRIKITNDGTTVRVYVSWTMQPYQWVLMGSDTVVNLGVIDGVGMLANKLSNSSGFGAVDVLTLWDLRSFSSVI